MEHLENNPKVKITLSQEFERVAHACHQPLTMSEFLEILGVEGHALITLLFSFPLLLPIPSFGLSAIFGFVLTISGIGIMLKKPLKLPKKIGSKKIPSSGVMKMFHASAAVMRKVEKLLKPRWSFMCNSTTWFIAGALIFACGFIILLPLPPGFNLFPALVCAILALGMVERDGLFIFLGITVFIALIVFLVMIFTFGIGWVKTHFGVHMDGELE